MNHHLNGRRTLAHYSPPPIHEDRPRSYDDDSTSHVPCTNLLLHHSAYVAPSYMTETTHNPAIYNSWDPYRNQFSTALHSRQHLSSSAHIGYHPAITSDHGIYGRNCIYVHDHICDYTCTTQPPSLSISRIRAFRNNTTLLPESCLAALPSHPHEATNRNLVQESIYTAQGRALRNDTSFRPESCLAALPSHPHEATNRNQVQESNYTSQGRALRNNTSFRPENCLAALPSHPHEDTSRNQVQASNYIAEGRALRNNTSFRPENCLAALPSHPHEDTSRNQVHASNYIAEGRALRNNTSFRPENCLAALPSHPHEATNQSKSSTSAV